MKREQKILFKQLPLSSVAVGIFGAYIDKNSEMFSDLKVSIISSGMNVLSKTYIACMMLYVIIITISVFIVSALATFVFHVYLINPAADTAIFTILAGGFSLAFLYGYPSILSASRAAEIEVHLPFVLAHMSTIASSGAPPSAIFRLVSRFKEYGQIAVEFEKISRNIESFGMDEITAMKDVMAKTPSFQMKEILGGMITTIASGGRLSEHLAEKSRQAMFEYKMVQQRYTEMLAVYADIYAAILIAAPLLLITTLAVIAPLGGSIFGIQPMVMIYIIVYLLVPLLNIMFLLFLHITKVKGI